MAGQDEIKKLTDQRRIENARVGYQVAINLWAYEGATLWSKFNALLLANSIILAIVGLSINASSDLTLLSIIMSFSGIILCVFWFLLTARSFNYYKYWLLSAREIEEQHLSDPVKTVSRGGLFAENRRVKIKLGGKEIPLRMSCWGRVRVRTAAYLIISLFCVMYIAILVMLIMNVVN